MQNWHIWILTVYASAALMHGKYYLFTEICIGLSRPLRRLDHLLWTGNPKFVKECFVKFSTDTEKINCFHIPSST